MLCCVVCSSRKIRGHASKRAWTGGKQARKVWMSLLRRVRQRRTPQTPAQAPSPPLRYTPSFGKCCSPSGGPSMCDLIVGGLARRSLVIDLLSPTHVSTHLLPLTPLPIFYRKPIPLSTHFYRKPTPHLSIRSPLYSHHPSDSYVYIL